MIQVMDISVPYSDMIEFHELDAFKCSFKRTSLVKMAFVKHLNDRHLNEKHLNVCYSDPVPECQQPSGSRW